MRMWMDTAVAVILLALSTGASTAGTFVPKDIDEAEGPKVYSLGNSHTDSIREELCGLAVAAGHNGYAYGTHTIPGAPLRWLKNHPKDSFEQLKQHAWDVVTLQSYNSTTEEEIQAAIDYAGAAWEGNKDVQVIMYSIWPNEEDWDNPGLGRREEWNEGVRERIRKAHPGIKVHVAPTSLIIRRLGNALNDGLIPGLVSRRDMFADPGHMGPVGAYAITLTMCSMIFEKSPIGYPNKVLQTSGGRASGEVAFEIPEDTAKAIQRLVWDTLAEYEHDGVETGMVIPTGHLQPAVVGIAYDKPLPVINNPAPVQWTVKDGKLPAGLNLIDDRLKGTPTEAMKAELTLEAKAGDQVAERTVRLYVASDDPLKIPDQELALDVPRDHYYFHHFKATGNVGRTTWSVAEGELPAGLMLTDGGLLMGTAGEQGTFAVTVQAQDKHPGGARTAIRQLAFDVRDAGPGSLHARKVTGKWTEDGRLDESFWKLDNVLKDACGNEVARFDIVWFEDPKDRRPEKTRALLIAVKVTGRSTDALPLESVHLYLDGRHNREIIYNEDDLHWAAFPAINRDGEEVIGDIVVQGYKGPQHFDQAGRLMEDGTWLLEVEISLKVLAGHGIHTKLGPNITYGFNLAVGSKEDADRRVYLYDGPKTEKDTSVFGSLVIEG